MVTRQLPRPLEGDPEVMGMMFVQNDINLDTAITKYNRTPLLWAARNGHNGVVRMPSLGANLGKADNLAQALLPEAAGNEYEPMAARLQ